MLEEHDLANAIKRYYEREPQFEVKIPSGFEIGTIPPFYREKKATQQVLGVENLVWDWNQRDMVGQCTKRNCNADVRFYASKPLGHIFFFDIDEKEENYPLYVYEELKTIIGHYGFSHFLLTETTKGYHIWIVEIRANKIDYFPLFQTLKKRYKSDYEFGGQWILRLGVKPDKPAPDFKAVAFIRENGNKQLSRGHLTLLRTYAKMPLSIITKLAEFNTLQSTFARQVVYHTFDVHNNKINDRRF
jgi:hypothetical protein